MTREVVDCTDCPFVEREDWSSEDESGTDYVGCSLGGAPAAASYYERKKQIGIYRDPPAWCRLRLGDVLVSLRKK